MKSTLQLSDTELQMLQEVFQVFSKYKSTTRNFGVQLVHSHFPLVDDEILYETHNKQKRSLRVRPAKLNQFSKVPLATAWCKNKKGEIEITMFCCDDDDGGSYGKNDD